ncbi:MAG TPA: hypothetical protein PK165_01425, partial [bacterium]|nr:hypothetical protein [bacterium]HPO51474.1 hypothetical protein [bacterium]
MRKYIVIFGCFALLFSGCKMFQAKQDVAKVSAPDETSQTQQISSESTQPPQPAFQPSKSAQKTPRSEKQEAEIQIMQAK